MPHSEHFSRTLPQSSFSTIPRYKLLLGVVAFLLILAGSSGLAQKQPQTGQQPDAQRDQVPAAPPASTVIIPAGTRIALVLTHPIQSRHIHRGDDIYAQISSPVTSGQELAIPPTTFVQGKVDKLERRRGRAVLRLMSASMTLPNGYVVPVSGPLTLESADGYALKDPGQGRIVGAWVLPAAGLGIGTLIGHAAGGQDTTINGVTYNPGRLKSTAVGAMVGLATGGVASLVILTTSREFLLDVGSPLEMVLQQPLSLERNRLAEAIAKSKTTPMQAITPAPSAASIDKSPWDCPAGQEWCGARCVDTISFVNDSNNCGRCGNQCSFSETCTGGSCTCAPGYTLCMGSCTSDSAFLSDSSNCGRCGNHCSFNETCMGGTCMRTTPCAPGDITCHEP